MNATVPTMFKIEKTGEVNIKSISIEFDESSTRREVLCNLKPVRTTVGEISRGRFSLNFSSFFFETNEKVKRNRKLTIHNKIYVPVNHSYNGTIRRIPVRCHYCTSLSGKTVLRFDKTITRSHDHYANETSKEKDSRCGTNFLRRFCQSNIFCARDASPNDPRVGRRAFPSYFSSESDLLSFHTDVSDFLVFVCQNDDYCRTFPQDRLSSIAFDAPNLSVIISRSFARDVRKSCRGIFIRFFG